MKQINIGKERVLDTVSKNAPATLTKIAESLKINRMYISGYLSALKELGVIESKVVGTSIVYIVNGGKK